MKPLLLRSGLRWHARHRLQLALSVLGVALGVGVVVSVDVATGSARRAFELSAEAVTGRATHEIAGGPSGVPESLYVRLRVEYGLDSIAPVLDRWVRLGEGGRTVRLLGIDAFAEAPFRSYVGPASGDVDVATLLAQRTVLLPSVMASAVGVSAGDTVRVDAGGRVMTAVVAGVLEPADALARQALADVVLADIATAQELTGSAGVLDRIDVRVSDDDAGRARLALIGGALPEGARLLETEARTGATARLARAFETNLTALALVALVFGMFLIYNSVTFGIVQRRPLIGLLRAQGVTAGEVFGVVMAESAIIGLVATSLGIVLGVILGTGLLGLVARTINDLYFAVTVTSVHADIDTIGKAVLLGVGATLAASLPPAREAMRAPPRVVLARATLERWTRRTAGPLAIGGLGAAIGAAALLTASGRSLAAGFTALFIIILAAALVTPAVTLLFMRAAMPFAARAGPVARLAARGVGASLSRTGPAIAALAVAVAVGVSVTIMIASFRAGVVRWLGQSLVADVYVSAAGLGGSRTDAALDPMLVEALRAADDVAGLTTYRHADILIAGDLTRVIAVDLHDAHRAAFEFLDAVGNGVRDGAPAAAAWRAFDAGAVIVSEPLAWRRGLSAGDTILLPTDRGDRAFPVAAIHRDYASEHGVIFIDRTTYSRWWDDDVINAIAVFLAGDADADRAIDHIRALPPASGALVRSNRSLRDATLDVFDRTFVITRVLRFLALIVAFVGVTGALMALQLERAREFGVLRATGLTPVQVRSLVAAQTGLMGAAATSLAVPLGIVLSWAMVHIINRRAFGWTFDLVFHTAPFAQAAAVGIGAALLAGVYPAMRMARLRPADALRRD